MALTFSLIFWIFLRTISCQLECLPETLDDTEFYINVTEHIKVQSIDCIQIPHEVTFPRDKVTVPYKKMLFKGDPSNVVHTTVVSRMDFDTKDTFSIMELPRGEYEYGFKLEWGCNQTCVFPKRIHISVSAITTKPTVISFPMVEGQRTRILCRAPSSCSGEEFLFWKSPNADGQSTVMDYDLDYYENIWHERRRYKLGNRGRDVLRLYPTAYHHNTNITCVAKYDHDAAETTVTLTVKFSPRILNSSRCTVKGELLVCVCISWANPLSPIFWPLETLTDYSVASFSNAQRVRSTFSMPAANYYNDTVKCISSNEHGQAETIIPIQSSAEDIELNYIPESSKGFDSALPWITGVCFTLNLVFVAVIICVNQRSKKKKRQCEEVNTYASLRRADVEEEYRVISPQNK